MPRQIVFAIYISWIFPSLFAFSCYGEELNLARLLRNGTVRVETSDGSPLLRHRDNEPFIPASILKIATGFCSLEQLGSAYRFETPFFMDESGTLFVKGSGDPSLVSEVVDLIAQQLSERVSTVHSIVIDTSAFSDTISIDGSERSLNPYDAKNAAFVTNFSSAFLTHTRAGSVISAEPQTPLTPRSRRAGERLARGTSERINLSSTPEEGVLYGAELLAAFLRKHGVNGHMTVRHGQVPQSAREIFRYRSTQDLEKIVHGMLKFSNNFTANQLFLTLGAREHGHPATLEKAQISMKKCLRERVGWPDVHIEEGSGLSRKTRVTSHQMTSLLLHFERYRDLLPENDGFLAKTGSLRGVNSLAGYFSLEGHSTPLRFAIVINSDVPHLYKFKVGKEIQRYLATHQTTPNE